MFKVFFLFLILMNLNFLSASVIEPAVTVMSILKRGFKVSDEFSHLKNTVVIDTKLSPKKFLQNQSNDTRNFFKILSETDGYKDFSSTIYLENFVLSYADYAPILMRRINEVDKNYIEVIAEGFIRLSKTIKHQNRDFVDLLIKAYRNDLNELKKLSEYKEISMLVDIYHVEANPRKTRIITDRIINYAFGDKTIYKLSLDEKYNNIVRNLKRSDALDLDYLYKNNLLFTLQINPNKVDNQLGLFERIENFKAFTENKLFVENLSNISNLKSKKLINEFLFHLSDAFYASFKSENARQIIDAIPSHNGAKIKARIGLFNDYVEKSNFLKTFFKETEMNDIFNTLQIESSRISM
jgi:hypothetical protein